MKTNSTKRILSLVTALLLTAAMTACGTQPASSASSSSSQAPNQRFCAGGGILFSDSRFGSCFQ